MQNDAKFKFMLQTYFDIWTHISQTELRYSACYSACLKIYARIFRVSCDVLRRSTTGYSFPGLHRSYLIEKAVFHYKWMNRKVDRFVFQWWIIRKLFELFWVLNSSFSFLKASLLLCMCLFYDLNTLKNVISQSFNVYVLWSLGNQTWKSGIFREI